MNKNLSLFQKNLFTQFGEDGIIEEILQRINSKTKLDNWCVEFGAWDGIYLSNTANLIKNKNYKAVLIEGDKNKYKVLCRNYPNNDIYKICEFVGFEGDSSLDSILSRTPIPKNFDFLSIDIDGCDYFILNSLNNFKPKVICIEFNATIPNEVNFIQEKNFKCKHGSSAKSILELAMTKGYELVAVTLCNLILVDRTIVNYVLDTLPQLSELRDDSYFKTYLFIGYDGTILSNKKQILLPCHGLSHNIADIRILPRFLNKFPSDYNIFQKILFLFWLLLNKPKKIFSWLHKKFLVE
jgi:hypothetical protein